MNASVGNPRATAADRPHYVKRGGSSMVTCLLRRYARAGMCLTHKTGAHLRQYVLPSLCYGRTGIVAV